MNIGCDLTKLNRFPGDDSEPASEKMLVLVHSAKNCKATNNLILPTN